MTLPTGRWIAPTADDLTVVCGAQSEFWWNNAYNTVTCTKSATHNGNPVNMVHTGSLPNGMPVSWGEKDDESAIPLVSPTQGSSAFCTCTFEIAAGDMIPSKRACRGYLSRFNQLPCKKD